MDVSIALDRLTPGAIYTGSLTDNTQQSYDEIVWGDERDKPSWEQIEIAFADFEDEQSVIKNYQLWNYVHDFQGKKSQYPAAVDFITGLNQRLLPKNTFVFGELVKTIYYESRDELGVYHTPVVEEDFIYVRDPETGFPLSRETKIYWYYEDGTLDSNYKSLVKYYDDDAISTLNELARRRNNNIQNIIGSLIFLVTTSDPTKTRNEVIADGRTFFDSTAYKHELYINDGNYAIVDDVRNEATLDWWENDISSFTPFATIRSFVIYQLTMGQFTS